MEYLFLADDAFPGFERHDHVANESFLHAEDLSQSLAHFLLGNSHMMTDDVESLMINVLGAIALKKPMNISQQRSKLTILSFSCKQGNADEYIKLFRNNLKSQFIFVF